MSDACKSRAAELRRMKGKILLRRRLKLPLTLALIALSFAPPAAPAYARRQASTAALAPVQSIDAFSTPYQPGERLTYNVSFSSFATAAHVELFNAGHGTFYGRDGFQLRARVQTVGVVNAALYAVNDEYVTYVVPDIGLPFRTELRHFDAGAGSDATDASVPLVSYADGTTQTPTDAARGGTPSTNVSMPSTYDLLSALYRLRALPLALGANYPINAQVAGGTQYAAEARVMDGGSVKTPAGSFNTVTAQLRVPGNAQVNSYRLRIYFSNDRRHIPVLVTAQLPAGEVRAELASLEIVEEAPLPAAQIANALPNNQQPPANANPARLLAGGAGAAEAANTKEPSGLPFKVGEQLNFNFFLGTATQPVGVASFQVRARAKYFGRDGLLFASTIFTTEVGQRLFPVSDKYDSYVDATTLLPFRNEQRIQEGAHRAGGVIMLDQDRGTATFSEGGKGVEITVGTYDFVSVLYALRSFDLTPPKRNAVALLLNRRPRTLFISALRRETIELGGQRIPAILLALATDDPDGDRFNLRLWISSDHRRLPLRFAANTPLGPVRADLSIIPTATQ